MLLTFFLLNVLTVGNQFRSINSLNIVSVALSGFASYEQSLTAPTYDVAFEDALHLYPQIFQNASRFSVYRRGRSRQCSDEADLIYSELGNITLLLRSLEGPTIMQTSGCNHVAVTLGDFARELDVALIISTAGDPMFADTTRFPTVLGFGPADHASLAKAGRAFLRNYGWTTVTILCDKDYAKVSPFDESACKFLGQLLLHLTGVYDVHVMRFDPEKRSQYGNILRQIRKQSRIVIIICPLTFLRDLMIAALGLNMTNGDYVYLSPQSVAYQNQLMRPWVNDTNDEITSSAFRSLLLYTITQPDWKRAAMITQRISQISKEKYNGSGNHKDVNSLNFAAYEGFMAASEVLNDMAPLNHASDGDTWKNFSATTFANKMANRKFSFDTQDMRTDDNGNRMTDLLFYRFNNFSQQFEEAWFYNASLDELQPINYLANAWPLDGPPPNRPPCGYEDNLCFETGRSFVLEIGTSATAAVVLGILTVSFVAYRLAKRDQRLRSEGRWLLNPATFILRDTSSAETESTCFVLETTKLRVFDGKIMLHDNRLVYKESRVDCVFKKEDVIRKISGKVTAVASLSHLNVGLFYGILVTTKTLTLIWDFGSKGSLRHFLDASDLQIYPGMRLSFCWDLLAGLWYIHKTSGILKGHGNITSLTCVIDTRLSLQIIATGSRQIFRAAMKTSRRETLPTALTVFDLWQAPELLLRPGERSTPQSDIFSLAVVFVEILTGKYPLDAVVYKAIAVEETLQTLVKVDGQPWPLRIDVTRPEIPTGLRKVLADCLKTQPAERPSLGHLWEDMSKRYPRKNAIECLLGRLEAYAADLESKVAERSVEMLIERSKVDLLLTELMPATVVKRLRNHEYVEPETFDSVSVLFSVLRDFQTMSAQCKIDDVLDFLRLLYTTLDHVVDVHDVYKIEAHMDTYVVVSGLPDRRLGSKHAHEILLLALDFLRDGLKLEIPLGPGRLAQLQIGIHSGACAAGIVGHRMPRYCLFGDTMNTASRMQTHGEANKIHISTQTKTLIESSIDFQVIPRGLIDIKGKGSTETFWLEAAAT